MGQSHRSPRADVVTLDGKTLCGSFDAGSGNSALHIGERLCVQGSFMVLGVKEAVGAEREREAVQSLLERLGGRRWLSCAR